MTKRVSNADRWALITGGRTRPLVPSEATEVSLLAELLADPSTWVEPQAGLEDTVVRAVVDAGPYLHLAPEPQAVPTSRWHHRAAIIGGAAAAAVILIALFAGVFVRHTEARIVYDGELQATALAPSAHASAGVMQSDAGFRVVLDAHELPQLPEGRYYQAWLKNAQGIGVPIGTFSSSQDYVTLWAGASPDEFPIISVTIEAADDNQASSGQAVLVGQLHAV
jgi:Anti-sigma-K factor rskA, C-terminal